MTSHLPEPDEYYRQTGTGGTGDGDSGDARRFQMRIALIGAAGAIIAAAVGAVISLKPWSHPGPSPGGGGSASSTNIPNRTFRTYVGRSLTLSNGTFQAIIQLTRIVDPATKGSFVSPATGDRFVATEFRISDPDTQPMTGLTAFDNDATIVGSDGQTYSTDGLATASGCTSFHNGPDEIVSGQSIAECVVFQIPTGVSVSEVQVIGWGYERGIWSNP